MYGEENLNNFNANSCFQLLGTSITDFNYDTSQTTTAYCEKEPDNFFSNCLSRFISMRNDILEFKKPKE